LLLFLSQIPLQIGNQKFNGLNNVDWRWMVMLCQMTGSIYNGITHGEFMLKQSIELVPWDSPEEMAYRIK